MTPTTVLYHRVKKSPRNVAFIRDNESWTYERLATQVDRLARGLIEHGVGKGDRVALHMANLPELVIAYHACFRVGAIAAPLNIRFKTAELRPLLQRLRPALYIGQRLSTARLPLLIFQPSPGIVVSSLTAPSRVLGYSHGQDYLPRTTVIRSKLLWTWMRPWCCSRLLERPESRNS